jgi:AraC-like DNA-binding protein
LKIKLEKIEPDSGSSFRILLTPGLNDVFLWHFHPEYEIVYVEGAGGIRHIGDHISRYEDNDLVFIGPNIPHLNFDYGVKTRCEQVVVQMKEDFLGHDFMQIPELAQIRKLFENAKIGLSFYGETKRQVGEKLKRLSMLPHFDQLMELLSIFQILATTAEVEILDSRPLSNQSPVRERDRMNAIYGHVERHFQRAMDVKSVAGLVNLSTSAFCRYFRKITRMTFTDFVNQYRVNQAKNLLLQDRNVTEACFECGFENLSYFNKTFKKLAGENPSQFRKRHQAR